MRTGECVVFSTARRQAFDHVGRLTDGGRVHSWTTHAAWTCVEIINRCGIPSLVPALLLIIILHAHKRTRSFVYEPVLFSSYRSCLFILNAGTRWNRVSLSLFLKFKYCCRDFFCYTLFLILFTFCMQCSLNKIGNRVMQITEKKFDRKLLALSDRKLSVTVPLLRIRPMQTW